MTGRPAPFAAVRARRKRRRAAALAVAGLVGIAASAQAALDALAEPVAAAPVVQAAPSAGAVGGDAAPAPGVTGTIALPELPPEAALVPASALADGTVTPAPATLFRGRTPLDSARALECLTTAIYYEAASESDDGQRAVAQVVLNRVRHPAFPASVCGVVYQGSERATGCQFSFTCDGAMARAPSRAGWARAQRIAAAALSGHVFAPAGLATHYHTYAVKPYWSRTLVMTTVEGAHFFHRWKGWWGTAAAFRQGYSGVESIPARNTGTPAAPVPTMAVLTPAAVRPAAVTPPANIQPAYAKSGTALDTAPESQIQDKYRDSGTILTR